MYILDKQINILQVELIATVADVRSIIALCLKSKEENRIKYSA